MDLRMLYKTTVLKLMNALVFCDSFLLIFIGVGFKGDQGLVFGFIYGLIGGVVAMLMFDVAVVAMITMSARDRRPPARVKGAPANGQGPRPKV